MKKLVLTMAVASLAFSANSFAVTGKDKDGKSVKTESEKKEDARKAKEAGAAGNSARSNQAKEVANQLLLKTRVVSGSDVKLAGDRLAAAVDAGILRLSDLQALESNSSKEVAINASNLITVAAMKNQLRRDATDAKVAEQAEGFAKFAQVEVLNNLNGKTQWTADAEAKLNVTLVEATRALQSGDATRLVDSLVVGLKKAGFSEERIKEILKECFKISA